MSYHHPMPSELGTNSRAPNLEVLKDLCKEEIAAARTYEKALSLPVLARHSDVLERCHASHQHRAAELGRRITTLGIEPPSAPGVWGSLLPTLATAAAAMSEKLAISLLEESEDRALRRYRDQLQQLDPVNRAFLIERIVPAQDASHAAISELKQVVSA
jgi:hypothetical protein